MVIDVNEIPREGLHIDQDFDFASLELVEEEAVLLEPTHAVVEVRKAGSEVLIRGKITTRLSFICSRCLRPFEYAVDSSFDLVYLPEELDEVKEELEEDDLDRFFYYQQQLDLRDIILEQLNLSFPLRPLCSEDCEGICPVCGEFINQGRCSCQVQESDPRLEKLKSFLRDKK
ncbi:MAG: YceD family protein [Candidatus Saccharicenans sp.]|uniref:YceD family protein n=1 Tax=Candidatus Saccharicenans sp. TaxID=2819258 RepID=UPI00404B739C